MLQLKSKELFGGSRWNAPGGKLINGESPEAGTIRETFEETGLKMRDLHFHGILNFYLGESKGLDQIVFVFSSRSVKGKLRQSPEGRLSWFARDQIPYDQMWQDDRVWLPLLFEGRAFVGDFYFSDGYGRLESYALEEVRSDRSSTRPG